jgi:hypothetical protein
MFLLPFVGLSIGGGESPSSFDALLSFISPVSMTWTVIGMMLFLAGIVSSYKKQ